MKLIHISLGEEDFGNEWGLCVVLLGVGFFIGECRGWYISASLIAGLRARHWVFRRRPLRVLDLGIWPRLRRSIVRTLEGWDASAYDRARYFCTRCGANEIVAKRNGCVRGPCPMELRP